jgi:hypothetical protein
LVLEAEADFLACYVAIIDAALIGIKVWRPENGIHAHNPASAPR